MEEDGEGGSPPARDEGGSVHSRLFAMHADKMRRRSEKARESQQKLLDLSAISLEHRVHAALSPRGGQAAVAFGSSSPRSQVWAPDQVGAGGTSQVCSQHISDAGGALGKSPGPGDYNAKSTFENAAQLRRSPSLGAASAFRSKTVRSTWLV